MADHATMREELRDRIITDPDLVLEDPDVMNALIVASERSLGGNIVDLRGIAMERLEARLDRLEDTHRSVIAAAYENLAGTNLIQRAVLRLLDARNFAEFIEVLTGDVAAVLRVDCVRLVLETARQDDDPALRRLGELLCIADPGFVDAYMAGGRSLPPRPVTLRPCISRPAEIFGDKGALIRSEALLKLDLGPGRLPGMLAFGAIDPQQFRANQGTDLLGFFSGVFERSMRRWLG